jgi:hypothetical protein
LTIKIAYSISRSFLQILEEMIRQAGRNTVKYVITGVWVEVGGVEGEESLKV